jgi:hypothetical protein
MVVCVVVDGVVAVVVKEDVELVVDWVEDGTVFVVLAYDVVVELVI